MEITFFLAQFLGWYFFIVGLIFLVRGKALTEWLPRLFEDKSFLLIGGLLTLIYGLVTVILHNVWVADSRVIITILGWLSLIGGALLIGFPERYSKFANVFINNPASIRIVMVITMLFGAGLIWMSY